MEQVTRMYSHSGTPALNFMALQEEGPAEAIRVALKCLESMAARPAMFSLTPRHTAAALGCTLNLDRLCGRLVAALFGRRQPNDLGGVDAFRSVTSDTVLLPRVRSELSWQLTHPVCCLQRANDILHTLTHHLAVCPFTGGMHSGTAHWCISTIFYAPCRRPDCP